MNGGFINMSMENMVEQLIREKELERSGNIATGHEQVKVNWGKTLAMNLVGMRGSSVSVGRYFLFYFTREGIGLIEYHGKTLGGGIDDLLPWEEISDFRVKKGALENDMKFTYRGQKFHMKLSKVVVTDPWVKENMENLMEHNFFCPTR